MRQRDFDYIETRLLAPAPDLLDAVARLRETGQSEFAEEIMHALQDLTDECRRIRNLMTVMEQVQ